MQASAFQPALDLSPPAPRVSLRPYQEAAVNAIEDAWDRGIRRPLIAIATGGGKTIVFAHLAAHRGGRALILAHRDELIQQAADKFRMVSPGAQIGIVKAEQNAVHAPVVVASIQTLARPNRLHQLRADFSTIVADEAHHVAADSWQYVLRTLGSFAPGGPLTLGVTATPERADGRSLGKTWEEIVYEANLDDLILAGYLVDIKAVQVRLATDFNRLHTRAGDFIDSEVEGALLDANAPAHTVTAWQTHAAGRKTLIFTPTVKLAYRMAQAFRDGGVKAEAIDGTTNPTERRDVLGRFSRGETLVLCNAQMLTEGYDEPSVACVVIARPTKSRPFYQQMIGRGTRLHPTKDHLLVMDLVGASSRHDLVTTASLFDLTPEELGQQSVTEARAKQAAAERPEGLPPEHGKLVAARVDLFRRRPLHWIPVDRYAQQFVLPLPEGVLEMAVADDGWAVIRHQQGQPVETIRRGLTLEYAQGVAEDQARALNAGALTNPNARWRAEPASEKQLAALRRYHRDLSPELTKGEASDLLTLAIARRQTR